MALSHLQTGTTSASEADSLETDASEDAAGSNDEMQRTDDEEEKEHVVTRARMPSKSSPQMSILWQYKTFLGESLLTANTDTAVWKHSRKLMDPIFGRQGTARHFAAMCEAAETMYRGEGDAEDDLDLDWRTWIAKLSPRFSKLATAELVRDVQEGRGPGRAAEVQITEHKDAVASLHPNATISSLEELQDVNQSGRSTLSVWINLASKEVACPGDHIEVMPQNPESIVTSSLKALGLDPTTVVSVSDTGLSQNNASSQLQEPLLLSDFFTHKVNLLCPPTQAMASILSSKLQAKGLIHQANKVAFFFEAGSEESVSTVHDLILRTSDHGLTFTDWLSVLPSMRSRLYSVASSPLTADEPVRLLVSVPPDGLGQMTAFLARCEKGTRLTARVSTSNFRPPTHSRLLLIAAGTGLAPFLSFLEAKKHQISSIDRTTLIYGCRGSSDLLCEKELQEYMEEGTLSHLIVARSRDKDSPYKYVGDAIRGEKDYVRSEFCGSEKSTILICGAASTMAVNAHDALCEGGSIFNLASRYFDSC
ncbi:hypothetical protein CBS101457_004934 [Exobasidium rhododendri]|nr:hypothetical protein CBS101457_004934 [Exobasidium rhododendri]